MGRPRKKGNKYAHLTDCSFFIEGKCRKGDNCDFRHSVIAKATSQECSNWKNRRCESKACLLRHPKRGNQGATSKKQPQEDVQDQSVQDVLDSNNETFHDLPHNEQACEQDSESVQEYNDTLLKSTASAKGPAKGKSRKFLLKNLVPRASKGDSIRFIKNFFEEENTQFVDVNYDKTIGVIVFKKPVALQSVNEMLQANLGQGKDILAQATFGDNVLLADIPEEATKEDIKLEISQIINKFSVDYVTEDHYAIVKLNNCRYAAQLKSSKLVVNGKSLRTFYYEKDCLSDKVYEIINGHRNIGQVKSNVIHNTGFVDSEPVHVSKQGGRESRTSTTVSGSDVQPLNNLKKIQNPKMYGSKRELNVMGAHLASSRSDLSVNIAEQKHIAYPQDRPGYGTMHQSGAMGTNFATSSSDIQIKTAEQMNTGYPKNQPVYDRRHQLDEMRTNPAIPLSDIRTGTSERANTGYPQNQLVYGTRHKLDAMGTNTASSNSDIRINSAERMNSWYPQNQPVYDAKRELDAIGTDSAKSLKVTKKITMKKQGARSVFKNELFEHLKKRLKDDHSVEVVISEQKVCRGITYSVVRDTNVPPGDPKARGFFEMIARFFKGELTSASSPVNSPPQMQSKSASRSPSMDLEVELIIGDIASVQCDVIVNSTSRDLRLSGNACSRSLLRVAGQKLQQSCSAHISSFGIVKDWSLVPTDGGSLDCKKVFHLVLGNEDKDNLKKIINEVLVETSAMGYKSVAFPALGTGGRGFQKDTVIRGLDEAIREYHIANPKSSIEVVKIVVYDKDEETVRLFKAHFSASSTATTTVNVSADFALTLIGLDTKELDTAEKLLRGFADEHIVTIKNKIASLANLPDTEKKTLKKFATANNVYLEINDKGEVTLEGMATDNLTILNKCLEYTSNEPARQLPSHWDPMPKDSNGKEKPYHLITLSTYSKEYQEIKSKLLDSASGKIRNIAEIQRIQNPQLYLTYMIRKKAMDAANKSNNNERLLFHGTSKESCDAINHHGFNRSYAGKNAAAYGDGNYFALSSNYSTNYATQDWSGYRYMYLVKVLVGEYTSGARGMKAAPSKGYGTELYDSVVDKVFFPTIFVVFPDNQAYPEYLIKFLV